MLIEVLAYTLGWLSASLGVAHQYQNTNSKKRMLFSVVLFIMSFLLMIALSYRESDTFNLAINLMLLFFFFSISAMVMGWVFSIYHGFLYKRNHANIKVKSTITLPIKQKIKKPKSLPSNSITKKERVIIVIKLVTLVILSLMLSISASILVALQGPFSLAINLSLAILFSFPVWVLFIYGLYMAPVYSRLQSNKQPIIKLITLSVTLFISNIVIASIHILIE